MQLRNAGKLVFWRLFQGRQDQGSHTCRRAADLLYGDSQKEAIHKAWNLLTEVYGLSPDRLYVSYFEGDEKQGLKPDLEAKQLWLDLGVPEERILPGNAKDNFWGV